MSGLGFLLLWGTALAPRVGVAAEPSPASEESAASEAEPDEGTGDAEASNPEGSETGSAANAFGSLPPASGEPAPPRPCVPLAETTARVGVSFVGIQAEASSNEESLRTLETLIVDTLEGLGQVEVRTRSDLRQLLDEQASRWLAGCTDSDCQEEATSVLQSANTPLLLTAILSRSGGRSTLQLSLFSNLDGKLVGRSLARARDGDQLQKKLPRIAAGLLERGKLLKEGYDATGFPSPRFHLTLKLGNALSRIASLDRNVLAYRMDVETNLYVTQKVLLFLVVGMALGGGDGGGNADAVRLQVIPASFGAKRLWTFRSLRAWLGAGIGPGVLGLTRLDGGTRDFRSAFAMTLVAGGDLRIHRRWTLATEVSTNLTDAIFGLGSGDAEVPVVFGLTLGVSFLFF